MPSPQTVHIGHFSAVLKPVLTINSGDIVTIETATSLDPVEIDQSGAVPPSVVPEYQRAIHREVKDRGPSGHVLTGPIFVNGAQPGDTLEVRILEIDLCGRLWLQPSAALHGRAAGRIPWCVPAYHPIDRKAKAAQVAPRSGGASRPSVFRGDGVAPTPAMGRISASPPGVHTGNIDNKDLVAGTTLFMPVYAVGALFSVGDAHAAQGQGEIDLSAIETGNRGKFQFMLRKDIETDLAGAPKHRPTGMVMGLNPNLEEAMKIAVRETILFLTQRFPRLSRGGGLYDRERRSRLPRDAGSGRRPGHPRHDPEVNLLRAAMSALSCPPADIGPDAEL